MRSRYVGVGIFVVVGSLLFATAVFLIGNQHNFFRNTSNYSLKSRT